MGTTEKDREERFLNALTSHGYIPHEGYASLVDPPVYVQQHIIDSAAGNNAGQPYKRLQIPKFTGEEDSEEKALGVFRLQPYEAVIYMGKTPPIGDYFSFTPFLWARRPGKTKAKADWIFAALGDPLNNARIKTEGNTSPFHSNTLVIFTADKGVNEQIVNQAIGAGFPESMINSYVIPSKLLKMGVDLTDDTLLILVRAANMYNPAAAKAYNNDNRYARIFRITPQGDAIPKPLRPYDTPPLRNRKAIPEESLVKTGKSLAASLDDLRNAILARIPHLRHQCFDSTRWFAESRDVLETTDPNLMLYHKFVAGEAADTPYLRSAMRGVPANFTLREEEMVIVYGVNHAATGLATYSNFSVYGERILSPEPNGPYIFGSNDPIWCGVAGMASKDKDHPREENLLFARSAREFIPNDPNVDYLYAVRVLRKIPADLAKHACVAVHVPEPGKGPASGIELDEPVTIGYRAYLNKATGVGPCYEDIVPDRAIWFKLR